MSESADPAEAPPGGTQGGTELSTGGGPSRKRGRARRAGGAFDPFILCVLLVGPSMMGFVHDETMGITGALALGVFAKTAFTERGVRRPPGAMLVAFLLAGAMLLASQVPLPRSLLEVLSPGSASIYALGLPGHEPPTDWRGWNLAPALSMDRLVRWAAVLSWACLISARSGHPGLRRTIRVGILGGAVLALLVGLVHTLLDERAVFGLRAPASDPRGRWLWPMINENHWGAYLSLAAILAFDGATSPWARRQIRAVAASVGLVCAGVVMAGSSLSSQVGLALGMIVLLAFRARGMGPIEGQSGGGRRHQGVLALLAVAPIVVTLLLLRIHELSQPLRYADTGGVLENSGVTSKWHLYRDSIALALGHPWVGIGPGSMLEVFPRFDLAGQRLSYPWAESLPLQLVIDLGIPAGLVLFVLLARLLVASVAAAWASWEFHGAVAALVGLAVHEWFDFASYGGAVAFSATALLLSSPPSPPDRRFSARTAGLLCAVVGTLGAVGAFLGQPRESTDAMAELMESVRDGHMSLGTAEERLQRRHPSSYVLALDLAASATEIGDVPRVLGWLNRAQLLAPRATDPHLHTARFLLAMGLESQAAIEYRLAAHLDWRYQGPSILQEAATRISSVEALSALAGPERPETLPRLAWMLLERKDPRADQMARIAVERAPDEPMTALVASRTALGRGEIDEARRLAEGALANPGASQWLRIRATEVLWWSGLKEQAMERLRRILDGVSAQPDGEAWLEYGQWALSAGRMTEARIGFRRARAIGPTRMAARSLTEEARAELIAGRVLDAQVLLTRAGRLDPSLLDVPLLRAELFLRDGRREAAREQILRVLAADPDNGVAKALLERVDEIR